MISYSLVELSQNLNNIFGNPLVFLIIAIILGICTYTDIKNMKIYNKVNIIFFILRIGLIFIPVYTLELTLYQIVGAIIGAIILIIPAVHFMQKMGGDIKLIFVLGLYLGIDLILILLGISFIVMILFSLIKKVITKKPVMKTFVPFAPFFTTSFAIMFLIYKILF